jgi:flagellar motor switch protein FliN/FliY
MPDEMSASPTPEASPEERAADATRPADETPPQAETTPRAETPQTKAPPQADTPVQAGAPVAASPSDQATAFVEPDLSPDAGPELASIELLDDVELDVCVELGRTEMYIEDVLRLGIGSVVELNKLAGDPVDVYVNARLVARGEVLVLNDNFCVRINDIVSPTPGSIPAG